MSMVGAIWYDAQMLDPDRLIMEVLQDAESNGAQPVKLCRGQGFASTRKQNFGHPRL